MSKDNEVARLEDKRLETILVAAMKVYCSDMMAFYRSDQSEADERVFKLSTQQLFKIMVMAENVAEKIAAREKKQGGLQ